MAQVSSRGWSSIIPGLVAIAEDAFDLEVARCRCHVWRWLWVLQLGFPWVNEVDSWSTFLSSKSLASGKERPNPGLGSRSSKWPTPNLQLQGNKVSNQVFKTKEVSNICTSESCYNLRRTSLKQWHMKSESQINLQIQDKISQEASSFLESYVAIPFQNVAKGCKGKVSGRGSCVAKASGTKNPVCLFFFKQIFASTMSGSRYRWTFVNMIVV